MSKLLSPPLPDESLELSRNLDCPSKSDYRTFSSDGERALNEISKWKDNKDEDLSFFSQLSQKAEMLFLEFVAILILLIVIPLAIVITQRKYIMKSISYTLV